MDCHALVPRARNDTRIVITNPASRDVGIQLDGHVAALLLMTAESPSGVPLRGVMVQLDGHVASLLAMTMRGVHRFFHASARAWFGVSQ